MSSLLRSSIATRSCRTSSNALCLRRSTLLLERSTRRRHSPSALPPPISFAFDIDGVLIRGEEPIPAARKALSILDGDNEWGMKIPYILLTNGGGVGEEERCRRLSKQLGVQIPVDRYIQAHTIIRSIASKYADHPVLVLGGRNDVLRKVAENYGFKHVYNSLDVLAWNPSVWPFHDLTPEEKASIKGADFSKLKIAGIFVFHDPRNWALDVQVMCDVILSGGTIGAGHATSSSPVDVVFCNPDLIWRSDFPVPRFGQGAFRDAFQAVYKSMTGMTCNYTQYGKPTEATYTFAEAALKDLLLARHESRQPSVYMVGDNPESDIAGANAAGWKSILVHTGVYDPRQGQPKHVPNHQAKDVAEAVQWALGQEMRGQRA
ncbi:HAD hydrolase [Coniophora puteana RWD-64-598 SS2]|uniref:HAD hydrolase n=1 Tax=Coniophora puteana (strain RWD-64-598) TaxID=741705 RepID=A0A5M3MU45_CONPW|nr:HAD hydrolase [Coniophora puteana RWD-64-598 SS2]EIW82570.1 HAD hydrolase [Coniophora puteana RWD-64-598 SS2]